MEAQKISFEFCQFTDFQPNCFSYTYTCIFVRSIFVLFYFYFFLSFFFRQHFIFLSFFFSSVAEQNAQYLNHFSNHKLHITLNDVPMVYFALRCNTSYQTLCVCMHFHWLFARAFFFVRMHQLMFNHMKFTVNTVCIRALQFQYLAHFEFLYRASYQSENHSIIFNFIFHIVLKQIATSSINSSFFQFIVKLINSIK